MNEGLNVVGGFRDMVARVHDAGIGVIGSFMFGFEAEDDAMFEGTAGLADRAHTDVPQYSILTLVPGTQLHAQMETGGRQALTRSTSRLDTQRRVFGGLRPVSGMPAVSLASRRRVMAWASGETP